MIGLTRSWPAWFEFILFWKSKGPWTPVPFSEEGRRVTKILRRVVVTVEEQRRYRDRRGAIKHDKRWRIMRGRDLIPVTEAQLERDMRRMLKAASSVAVLAPGETVAIVPMHATEPGELVRQAEAAGATS